MYQEERPSFSSFPPTETRIELKTYFFWQAENETLRQKLDTLKQELRGKNKRLSLELHQTSETYEHDRTRLLAHSEQLSSDLDSARKQVRATPIPLPFSKPLSFLIHILPLPLSQHVIISGYV